MELPWLQTLVSHQAEDDYCYNILLLYTECIIIVISVSDVLLFNWESIATVNFFYVINISEVLVSLQ